MVNTDSNGKVAVLLCGSGYLDGSEIREAVLSTLALEQNQLSYEFLALDQNQFDTFDTFKQEKQDDNRNMLVESARIARGSIKPLVVPCDENGLCCGVHPDWESYRALVIPGGFGVAKSLCEFANKRVAGGVRPEIQHFIQYFYDHKRPIVGICIAPALIAMCLPEKSIVMTMGAAGDAATAITTIGHQHVVTSTDQCHVDEIHKVITTGAYMNDEASMVEVFAGISKAIKQLSLMLGA